MLTKYNGSGGDVTIPDGVISIGEGAFCDCESLSSVIIPDGVTSIGKSAFLGCTSLSSVTIPNGVTSIDDNAFRSCRSLGSITIPNSLTSINVDTQNAVYDSRENCNATVTITARTADGKTAKVKLKAGKQTLSLTVTPATADNTKVTWSSSDKKIASVDKKRKVTAKKKGTVTITAKAKDGSGKKGSIKIKIR